MASMIFALISSIVLPCIMFLYAFINKRHVAFLFGVLTFVGSQMLLRLPILDYLNKNSLSFTMFSVTHPVFFVVMLGLSAGIFEELARFIVLRFLIKRRDWQTGFFFGAGHGGIEAAIFVGIPTVSILITSFETIVGSEVHIIAGMERLFAMLLHIALTILVLQGVVRQQFRYVLIAIAIHAFVDTFVGLIPLFVPKDYRLLLLETTFSVIAVAVFIYSFRMRKKGDIKQ